MEFGVSTFLTDEGIAPGTLGRALEERGFRSPFEILFDVPVAPAGDTLRRLDRMAELLRDA